jgi:prophage antirepressor-like protein
MVANPFAEALGYTNKKKAIQQHVSANNQTNYSEIQESQNGTLASSLHPQTKFINRAGVFELINASDMPAAKRFKAWNNNDLLPILC